MDIASPCTGICKLDDTTGWCLGCGRSGDEIAEWGAQPAPWRDAVWRQTPARLTRLGVVCRRLPWTTEEVRAFAISSLREGRGTWVMGVTGAVAEFAAPPNTAVTVTQDGDDIIAQTTNGAVRMTINNDVRALTFDPEGEARPPRVVLAVKRERGRLPMARGVQDLGPDRRALIPEAGTRMFDLGLAVKEARFCVRVAPGAAEQALQEAQGLAFTDALPRFGRAVLAESPTRVVETALGRIEVQGQIPPPNAVSPAGPHTHLLPDHLATGRAMPIGMDLPRAYLPGAVFYPPK